MRPFAYERPADVDAAVAAFVAGADPPKAPGADLATSPVAEPSPQPTAAYLGGGTNLVDLMRLGVVRPARLVDVTRLGHDAIEPTPDGGLLIGAAVRNSDLAADPTVRRDHPLLSAALLAGASGQLRNMATTGGNLLQRTRCPYFQDATKPCNKRDPGSGCPAREGEHRNLAVIGHSAACVATHPSDMAVALTALGATVHVQGPDGTRQIAMPGLHRLPGDRPQDDTVLAPGELITAVALPAPIVGAAARYRKVRERASFAFALVSVAAVVRVDAGVVAECRIAFGGLAHVPWRAARTEAALVGGPATRDAFLAAADAELAHAEPLRDNAYKLPLARNVLATTLEELCA